jgi:hypothetical protein
MIQITPGAIVSGKSGKKFLVDRVEGDIIHSGGVKFLASAVINVIPPRPKEFKLGDRVRYTGTDRNLQRQYAGELSIWEISKHDDGYACLKPDGRVTSWILFKELQLATDTASPLSAVTQPPRRISIGDDVTIRSTQQQGKIAIWYRNRSKAVIELEDGTLSDWVRTSDLVRISDGAIESTPSEPLPSLPANWKPDISPSDDESDDLID